MKKVRVLLFIVSLFLGFSGVANANIISNGSFEVHSSWIFSNVERVSGYWPASDGQYSVDLNMNSPGYVSQVFSTISGDKYEVSFDMAGNMWGQPIIKTLLAEIIDPTDSVLYSNQYVFDTTGWTASNGSSFDAWESHLFFFTATSTTATIKFSSLDPSYFGPVIDNVIVNPSTVSIPGAFWLFGSGLISLVGLRKRFRKK